MQEFRGQRRSRTAWASAERTELRKPGNVPSVPEFPAGTWPNSESLGLPGGLNGSPLNVGSLLSLLPGIDCGGMGGGSGFIGATPSSGSPCFLDFSVVLVAAVADRPKAHDDTGSCAADTGRGGSFQSLCDELGNGWTDDTDYSCEGNGTGRNEVACCVGKAAAFWSWCNSRNHATTMPDTAYSFRPNEDDYINGGRKVVCCRKRKY